MNTSPGFCETIFYIFPRIISFVNTRLIFMLMSQRYTSVIQDITFCPSKNLAACWQSSYRCLAVSSTTPWLQVYSSIILLVIQFIICILIQGKLLSNSNSGKIPFPPPKKARKPQRYSVTTSIPFPDFNRSLSVNCKIHYRQDEMTTFSEPHLYHSFALPRTINCTCFPHVSCLHVSCFVFQLQIFWSMGGFCMLRIYSMEHIWALAQKKDLRTLRNKNPHKVHKGNCGVLSIKPQYMVKACSFLTYWSFTIM